MNTVKNKNLILSDEEKSINLDLLTPLVMLISFRNGLIGFFFVFILNVLTKLVSLISSSITELEFTSNDFIFSFWGFLAVSFIDVISQTRTKKTK